MFPLSIKENIQFCCHCYFTENEEILCFVFNGFSCCLSCSVRPSLIEYLSYNLNFLSVLVGPCSDYQDYIDFIEGRHISKRLKQHSQTCNGQNGYDRTPDPSPLVSSGIHVWWIVLNDTAQTGTIEGVGSKWSLYFRPVFF